MKRLIVQLILILSSFCLFGQGNNRFNKPPISILSPDAADLGRYGAYNINHYTGTPNISIPLYTINESGTTIPIAINYESSGFIPNKNAGVVGQNWNLSAGGAITRIVNGVPDDRNRPVPEGLDEPFTKDNIGLISGFRQNSSNTWPLQTEVENLDFLSNTTTAPNGYPIIIDLPGSRRMKYEYNPDIFSFNFLGHSGTFFMGNDGNVKVSSDRNYKVDISGMLDQNDLALTIYNLVSSSQLNSTSISTITITSDDGYKFTFGGKLNALELSFFYTYGPNGNYNTNFVKGQSGVINTWYLTKIEVPDGDVINFEYQLYSPNDALILSNISNPTIPGNTNSIKVDFLDIQLSWSDHKEAFSLPGGSDNGVQPKKLIKTLIKRAYLKKIETKLRTVTFIYSRRNESNENLFYTSQQGGTPFSNYVGLNPNYFISKLDRITIKDKVGVSRPYNDEVLLIPPQIIFDFTYQFYGYLSVGHRLFLTKVENENKSYQFEYSRVNELVHPLSAGIDKWGYYNGHDENLSLIGVNGPVYGDPAEYETNFTYQGQIRTADPLKSNIGLLQKITFPTGGKSIFEFEGHKISRVLKRMVNPPGGNTLSPVWQTLGVNDDPNVGGCRIKKITSIPGPEANPGAITTTEYKYIKDYNQNPLGPSSGQLTEYGVFRMKCEIVNTAYFHEQLFDQNIAKSNSFSESPVCYSEVVEIRGTGEEGFTKYVFTNPDNVTYSEPGACPDIYLASNNLKEKTTAGFTGLLGQMRRLARYNSRSNERGKLWKKEVYSQANILLTSEEYEYNRDPNRFNEKAVGYERIYNQTLTGLQNVFYIVQSVKLYNYHNNPSKITEKIFANGQTQTQITTFTYKSNSYPLLTERTITKSDGSILKSKYFYPEDRIGDPDFPASSGMVNKNMVATVVEEQTYKGSALLQTQKNIYTDATGSGGYKLQTTKTIDNTISPTSIEQWMNITYYSDGTVKESYKQNDLKTAYIWDYKKSYPIAKVENVQSAGEIAYTSFETSEDWQSGGYNQWTYNTSAKKYFFPIVTGSMAYDLNYNSTPQTVTRSLDASKQYVLSLWYNGSNLNVGGLTPVNGETIGPWTYKEYAVSGLSSITISGTGLIDELRLYPKGAFMTTFTYQPLFGLTTSCDANNWISYYTYDDLGRLIIVRDKEGNILKKICYNFAGQVENCSTSVFRSNPVSQNFTKNDCGEGYEGGSVIYAVPEYAYTSDISQEDANQKAQKDLLLNGQTFANANGSCNCTTNSCTGVDKKCINGICETGQKKYIASTYIKSTGLWACVYIYEWSDCTISQQYSENSSTACSITPTCLDY